MGTPQDQSPPLAANDGAAPTIPAAGQVGRGAQPRPGWSIAGGHLREMETVVGHLQRGTEVRASCYSRDCRRTQNLEFDELVRIGQGLLFVRDLQRTYACARLGGCRLTWSTTEPHMYALGELTGRPYVAVEVTCACDLKHVTTVAAMIRRLQAAKTGGPETSIRQVASLLPPCAKCRMRRWRVEILWYDPDNLPNGRQPLWKQDLDQRLREVALRRAREPMAPGPP